MKDIKAIETEYNGYRFRSRLEARVAVLFSDAGIAYEYEPEGYKHDDGTMYLPDFYLPEEDIYVEVKPIRKGFAEEIVKASKFLGGKIRGLMVITEIPKPQENYTWWFPVLYVDPLSNETRLRYVPLLMSCEGDPWFFWDAAAAFDSEIRLGWWSGAMIASHLADFKPINDTCFPYMEYDQEVVKYAMHLVSNMNDNLKLADAYRHAYQARFEHGEKG